MFLESMSVDHALCCHKGGYTICRHNKVRDLTEVLLREVCPNTSIEPPLQPLSGESFEYGTSSCEDEVRLDIKANGFLRAGQEALFDVRVFTQTPLPTSQNPCLVFTDSMKWTRKDAMENVSVKLREQPSLHWCLHVPDEWRGSVPHFSSD